MIRAGLDPGVPERPTGIVPGATLRDRRRRWPSFQENTVPAVKYRADGDVAEGVSRELGIQRRQIADQEILERLLHPLASCAAARAVGGVRAGLEQLE
jgi:hypothetical protein